MDEQHVEGWAVARGGVSPAQLESDFAALRERAREAWQLVFPPRRGYLVMSRPLDGPLEGVRVDVSRGDFRAELDLRCEWQVSERRGVRGLVIRSSARAHSAALELVDDSNRWLLRGARRAGMALAAVASVAVFLAFAGSHDPVIAGLLLTILVASLFAAFGLLADRLGDELAAHRRRRICAAIESDLALRESFRRFGALGRELRAQRRELDQGRRGAPFRRDA